MKTVLICYASVILFLIIFYFYGRALLSALRVKTGFCDNIIFGFVFLLLTYHLLYLPFFLTRGSYRLFTWIWLGIMAVGIIPLIIRQRIHLPHYSNKQYIIIGVIVISVVFLCIFIPLHSPAYGQDINTYINSMNQMYYEDVMWVHEGRLNIHNGSNSIFAFMTIPSLLFGVRPYYISLITMRSLLVILTIMIAYRSGKIAFNDYDQDFSGAGIAVALLAEVFLMCWNSMYQPHFFFRRSNEAKAFCQFVLFPLAVSVFLQMCKTENRKTLWIEQFIVGLSAIAISMSSLIGYPFLVAIGLAVLLAIDKCRKPAGTIGPAIICALPNLVYYAFFYFTEQGAIYI